MVQKKQPSFKLETPGEVLKKHVVDANGVTQDALALAMGVSRLTVNQLLNDKRNITAEMALRLAKVLSTSPEFWLDIQRDTDLLKAEQKLSDMLPKLRVLREPSPPN